MKKIHKVVFVIGFAFIASIVTGFIVINKGTAIEAKEETPTTNLIASENKISGSMTKDVYSSSYAALNQTQNDAWNAKYNFKPETNVKSVSNWDDFKAAFQDNNVSKIILTGDISYAGAATRLNRTESIELDGGSHTLEMRNSSLSVENLTSLNNFTKKFSDVPVFHMHDINIINNARVGALEGDLYNAWSFINGYNWWGPGGSTAYSTRGLWQYRIGNVTTPYDEKLATNNQRVGGRLIGANRGQISMWGYNVIVTGAENFYTGGLEVEPYTYYRGEIAAYNYSTIWFVDNTKNGSNVNDTGSRKFEVGEGSFVYLHNTTTNTGYPAVYEFFDEMNIGKNATYNANVAGTAVSFNVNNAKLIAQEGATVNLLSRSTNSPTLALGSSTNTNGTINPNNISVEFREGSFINIVGTNGRNTSGYSGIIGYFAPGNSSRNATVTIDKPASFDIVNLASSGALGFYTPGTFNFSVNSSDISLWKTTTATTSSPDSTYPNVASFAINSNTTGAKGTSSNSNLQTDFVRSGYRRINGLNTIPEIEWEYVTTADYSQKAKVLLGQVATGGSDPFDQNGDAKMTNVYADNKRLAQIDFTDTLGNTYLGYSGSDNYVTWAKADHTIPGFQTPNELIKGIASKVDNSSGSNVPYSTAEESSTKVLLVTPPEPINLTAGTIRDTDKSLTATGIEPNAKVYIQVNDGSIVEAGTADATGNWTYDITTPYTIGDKVRIYLENMSELPDDFSTVGLENTRVNGGNRNPVSQVTYRDATFKPATVYVVEKGVITNASVVKSFTSDTSKVGVGSTLTYSVKISNNEEEGSGITWKDVVLSDVLDSGVDYDASVADVAVNGTAVSSATYDASTRTLSIPVGTILPTTASGDNTAVVTFKVIVNEEGLDKTISNKAHAAGKNDVDETFEKDSNTVQTETVLNNTLTVNFVSVAGGSIATPVVVRSPIGTTVNLDDNADVQATITHLLNNDYQEITKPNPISITITGNGDEVTYVFDGVLSLKSAPSIIDFGTLTNKFVEERVDDPTVAGDLVVSDTRVMDTEGWKLTAKVTKPMTNTDGSGTILNSSFEYVKEVGEQPIALDSSEKEIASSTEKGSTNITSSWGSTSDSKGLKFIFTPNSTSGTNIGSFESVITWTLTEAP